MDSGATGPAPSDLDEAAGGGLATWLSLAGALARERRAFALVTVVRALSPTSGKPGDKAILTEDGRWHGWVGGSCAEPTARRAALEALADGRSRLVQLTNDESEPRRPGVERTAMSCHSGGTMELYVEPHLPEPDLVVFGSSPIALSLCRLGRAMGYRVTRVQLGESPDASGLEPAVLTQIDDIAIGSPARSYVVVASHGREEEAALRWALAAKAAYVGLVASRRRFEAVAKRLASTGVDEAARASIDAPAGLDIGATAPEEVALSVLAEVVRRVRGGPSLQSRAASRAPELSRGKGVAESPRSCCGAGGGKSERSGVSAVVLAAGLSRRMGEDNKLLLPVLGKPMLQRVVEAVRGAGVSEIVVVVGHDADAVRAVVEPLGVRIAENPDFATGQVSSVRAGLSALGPESDAVLMCLGDQPLLTEVHVRRLLEAYAAQSSGEMLVPRYRGTRGNPVVLSRRVAQQTLARGDHYGCRHFMDENADLVCFWDADSDAYVRDVDQPADYREVGGAGAPPNAERARATRGP